MEGVATWYTIALVAVLSALAGFCVRLLVERRQQRRRTAAVPAKPLQIEIPEAYQRVGRDIALALNEQARVAGSVISPMQRLQIGLEQILNPLDRLATAMETYVARSRPQDDPRPLTGCGAVEPGRRLDRDYLESRGLELLKSLSEGGRQAAESNIDGLRQSLSAKGLEAGPLVTAENKWLLAALFTPGSGEAVVVPALATVIGPVQLVEWYQCEGCDGTTPLTLKDIRSLAHAHRGLPDGEWRLSRKGLLHRESA